jgi:cold shock CspA family protein
MSTARASRTLQVGEDHEGTCSAWFDHGRGYGFIQVAGVAQELFVPSRNLSNAEALQRGDRVRFEVRMGSDGKLMADGVELQGR